MRRGARSCIRCPLVAKQNFLTAAETLGVRPVNQLAKFPEQAIRPFSTAGENHGKESGRDFEPVGRLRQRDTGAFEEDLLSKAGRRFLFKFISLCVHRLEINAGKQRATFYLKNRAP